MSTSFILCISCHGPGFPHQTLEQLKLSAHLTPPWPAGLQVFLKLHTLEMLYVTKVNVKNTFERVGLRTLF